VEKVVEQGQLVQKLHFLDNVSETLNQIIENLLSAARKALNISQTIEDPKAQNDDILKIIEKLTKDTEYKK
jgi:Fic family protein